MTFQSSVEFEQGAGQAGELFSDAPHKAQPFTIVSDPVENVIGNACTVSSEGYCEMGGTGVFAGILMSPKSYALHGTAAGGSLAPSVILPDQTEVEVLNEGEIWVNLATSANIGDSVIFAQADGELKAISPTATLTAAHSLAYATVVRYTLAGPGLAVIQVLQTPTINTP